MKSVKNAPVYGWILLLIASLFLSLPLLGQAMLKEKLVFLTAEWEGERFPDGRPT